MRLGAAELTESIVTQPFDETSDGQPASFDAVWTSSMLDVGLWRGLAPPAIAALPHVLYFHENQFAYPASPAAPGGGADPRDLHFGLTNFTAALATLASGPNPWTPGRAPRLWWNSAYNRDTFTVGVGDLLGKTPAGRSGHAFTHWLPRVAQASCVQPPGVEPLPSPRRKRFGRPPHLLWAARWEHDKQPEVFFRALHRLEKRGVDFRISVLGESFQLVPAVFEQAQQHFGPRILRWGFQAERAAYAKALSQADVFVSTAAHEFFGLAAVEAAAAGCTLVLPDALAYPEVFGPSAAYYPPSPERDPARRTLATAEALADTLAELLASGQPRYAGVHAQKYAWDRRVRELDDALEAVATHR